MKRAIQLEHRASSSRSKHEGESSLGLCDRLDRTRDNSQRQLPTDHDYAVPTREYQTDQSSLKPAQAAARSVLGEKQKQRQRQKQPHRLRRVDRVTPYQAFALIDGIAVGSSATWTFLFDNFRLACNPLPTLSGCCARVFPAKRTDFRDHLRNLGTRCILRAGFGVVLQ